MSTKDKVLELLQKSEEYISGEDIANRLGISRTAVWKAIKSLRDNEFEISANTNKGYFLNKGKDIISVYGIKSFLKEKYKENPIFVYDTIDSTNWEAKRISMEGAVHGTIIVSDEQTKGRGRYGRAFASKKGKGIYMSMVLKPEFDIYEVAFSTIISAVGVLRALKKFTTEKIEIKWVNDLYINSKKICGILNELVCDIETKNIDFIVTGIGININACERDFDDDIKDKASSLQIHDFVRNNIISEIANEILDIFENFDKKQILEEYKNFQMLFGKEIVYEKDGEEYFGIAEDISDDGGLIIKKDEGYVTLNSGEVSVRQK